MKQPATPSQAADALIQLKGFIGNAQRRVFCGFGFFRGEGCYLTCNG